MHPAICHIVVITEKVCTVQDSKACDSGLVLIRYNKLSFEGVCGTASSPNLNGSGLKNCQQEVVPYHWNTLVCWITWFNHKKMLRGGQTGIWAFCLLSYHSCYEYNTALPSGSSHLCRLFYVFPFNGPTVCMEFSLHACMQSLTSHPSQCHNLIVFSVQICTLLWRVLIYYNYD